MTAPPPDGPGAEISRHVWDSKYRFGREPDAEATWRRLARALAAAEPHGRAGWEALFLEVLEGFAFMPGGRIQAGAGTDRAVTLFNCFVMGPVEDSIDGIFQALRESAVTLQQGGGVGLDFSTLRPFGAPARASGAVASGPVSFMEVWDAMCATLLATGARRGAMMATLRCDHPDIERFIDAKRAGGRLTHFNLSVLVTDAFVEAVRADEDWALVFPAAAGEAGETVRRAFPGVEGERPCRVWARVRARELWRRMHEAAFACAEPGVLFIDRINRLDPLAYAERIVATNPCGETPLPYYGACDLGSLNLTRFVVAPFSDKARLDLAALGEAARVAVRMLDNVIDVSRYPLPQQRQAARASRRIGLGVTGLADALVMLGLRYDTEAARVAAAEAMRTIRDEAYRASAGLAREKGPFPLFDAAAHLAGPFVAGLPDDIRAAIAAHGLRNSHLLAIAPAGTISLLAGNISSGLEPIFAADYDRDVLAADGAPRRFRLTDRALALWRGAGRPGSPPAFVTADDVSPEAQLAMQAALQPFVDNAISKTVTVPATMPFDRFAGLFDAAYDLGLKGCSVFRPNAVTGEVLRRATTACCTPEREAD